jgi:hypothetical protein
MDSRVLVGYIAIAAVSLSVAACLTLLPLVYDGMICVQCCAVLRSVAVICAGDHEHWCECV